MLLKFPDRLRKFFGDRRSHSGNSVVERRHHKMTRDEADKRLHDAVEDLEMTIRCRRDDIFPK